MIRVANGKKTTYTPAFKAEPYGFFPEGGRNYQQLMDELSLKDKKTLRSCVAKVHRGESLEDRRGTAPSPCKGQPRR